jgi:hypothetical protein
MAAPGSIPGHSAQQDELFTQKQEFIHSRRRSTLGWQQTLKKMLLWSFAKTKISPHVFAKIFSNFHKEMFSF